MFSWRKILVPVSGEEPTRSAGPLSSAFSLARRFAARIEGAYVPEAVRQDSDLVGVAHAQVSRAMQAGSIATKARPSAESSDRARAALAIHARQFPDVPSTLTALEGELGASLAHHARLADVAVVGSSGDYPSEFWQTAREATLFASGRPVFVVPSRKVADNVGETLLIAWKDDAAASRALALALPLIAKARYVCLMGVGPEAKIGASLREAHRYLKLHNPEIYIEPVEAGDRLAGELLLAKADLWEDVVLVMGAYGHSRLHERVMGGVTEYVLRHTTVPVLMAH